MAFFDQSQAHEMMQNLVWKAWDSSTTHLGNYHVARAKPAPLDPGFPVPKNLTYQPRLPRYQAFLCLG